MEHLRIRDFLLPGEAGHFARSRISGEEGQVRLHDHDFAEVCWIEAGHGALLSPSGTSPLGPGDLALVAPADVHGFAGSRTEPLRLVNLAVPLGLWRRVVADLGMEDPLDRPAAGRRRRLAGPALALIETAAAGCERGHRDPLAVQQLLLAALDAFRPREAGERLPPWFAEALRRFRAGGWHRGLPGLVAASGRSREHVARRCRELLGCTPADLLNQARVEALAQALMASDAPVTELIADAGFANPTHAYRLFRRAHGRNPGEWRDRQRRIFGLPS